MKAVISVYLYYFEEIYRQIVVDYDIKLTDLCEYIIVSMNGSKIPFYSLYYNKVEYFAYKFDDDDNDIKSIFNLKLSDLNIKMGSELELDYNLDQDYYFIIKVDAIENLVNFKNEFEVLNGAGYGILDSISTNHLRNLLINKDKKNYYLKVDQINYLKMKFDINENNDKIREYIKYREELTREKRYVFNVSLDEFDKEIKRKIVMDNDLTIDTFCKKVIASMNGSLGHAYIIKRNKDYLDEEYFEDVPLYYIDLKEKQRLKVIYDFGDNWIFNVTVSKIIDGYGEENSEVISGKGYGIIDDCGGTWGLDDIFSGKNDSWGSYDINEFDLEECNRDVQMTF